MTWHQWHQPVPRSRRTSFFPACAFAKISGERHSSHATARGALGGGAGGVLAQLGTVNATRATARASFTERLLSHPTSGEADRIAPSVRAERVEAPFDSDSARFARRVLRSGRTVGVFRIDRRR